MLSKFGTRVREPGDIPSGEHYAILVHHGRGGWEYWFITRTMLRGAVELLERKTTVSYRVLLSRALNVRFETVVEVEMPESDS